MTKEQKELKNNHWLWRYMTDKEFELMDDEFETHCQQLPLEEYNSSKGYFLVKAIEREHTKKARERMWNESRRKFYDTSN